jgi:3-methyl-2-oxobutanoate hydroxymethyltransferase
MEKKFTVNDFSESKKNRKKISMLTAYDYPTSKLMDEAGVDSILVGDSLGMVVLGYEDTTRVTMEDMLHHTKAVTRGVKRAMVVADMPFLSYHLGRIESVRNAGRLISEGGCSAVKLEGGRAVAEDIKAIISAGIPVIGHLGYTPQSINLFGGHKAQGKTIDTARRIVDDARLLQEAGVFSLVLECVPFRLAGLISRELEIPVIGIGSGNACDGQVLVIHDVLGLGSFSPKHAKVYADVAGISASAIRNYIEEINAEIFPTEKNSFIIEEDVYKQIEKELKR